MEFNFKPLTIEDVKVIESWNYESYIEQVLMTPYFQSFHETGSLSGPGGCEGFVALLDNELSGIFEFHVHEEFMDIGLALKSSLIGKGYGKDYVNQGIKFGIQWYSSQINYVRLEVNRNNKAAIRVYEKVGFYKVNGSDDEIEMVMKVR